MRSFVDRPDPAVSRPAVSRRGAMAFGLVVAVLLGSLATGVSPAAATGGTTYTVSALLTVGSQPVGVAFSPDGARVFVTNRGADMSVINTSSNAVTSFGGGFVNGPFGVAVSPDGSKLYMTNFWSGDVRPFNATTLTAGIPVNVGGYSSGLAMSPDGSRLYVANMDSTNVSVINTSTNTVAATVAGGSGFVNSWGVAVSPDGSRVYATNYGGTTLIVINTSTNTVAATVNVGSSPAGVAVSPDGSRVYVANSGEDTVSVINTSSNTVAATVTVAGFPLGVAVSPDGSRAYVTDAGTNSVSVIDTSSNTVETTFSTGGSYPVNVAVSPDGSRLYVTNFSTGNVSVVDIVEPATAPAAPTSLVATPGDGSASIAFTPGADGGVEITKYQVKVGNGAWTDVVGTTSPITVSGLTNYATASIRLRAVNSAGAGAASAFVQVWPRRASSSLTSVTAASRTSLRASFAALTPAGGSVSHYWVYAYTKGTNTVAGSCRSTAAARNCTVTGLSANTEYDVAVRGFFTLTGSPTVLPTLDSARQTVRTRT